MTATRAKPSVLEGLKDREQKWAKAQADASALARDHGAKIRRAQELNDERGRLIHRDPSLVDHLGVPVGPDNPVGEIDKKIAALGDVEDLWRQVEHARRLEESAKQSWDDFVASHFWELIEAHWPAGEAIANSANEAARVLVEELNRYLEFHSRIAGFTHPLPNVTTHIVPGLEAAANFLKVAESIDLQPPLPELPEEIA
jgi:hypothetical protein